MSNRLLEILRRVGGIGFGGLALALVMAPAPQEQATTKVPAERGVGKTYRVPYRLTDTNHFLVRTRINGKGPFNFLVDTGAPLLYVSTDTAKKVGLAPAEGEYFANVDRIDFEGGPFLKDFKGRVEDPFQLIGMNALGLPGASIDGILGFSVLARFKIEIDPSKDRMSWTRLDFEPKDPFVPRNAVRQAPAEVQAMNALGPLAKGMAMIVGKQPEEKRFVRGMLGLTVQCMGGAVLVESILPRSAAEKGGLQVGDQIARVDGQVVGSLEQAREALAKVKAGATVPVFVYRGMDKLELKVKTAEGF